MHEGRQPSQERQLLYLRWALISSIAYMVVLRPDGRDPTAGQLGYVVALLASNLLIPRLPYRSPQSFGSLILLVDTVFISLGLAVFGSASQDLLIGYFLCILMATFADTEARIAAAAVLVTTVYSFWLLGTGGPPALSAVLIRLPFLFVVTVFYGYMMARVRHAQAERRSAEARAEALSGLLDITRSFSAELATATVVRRIEAVLSGILGAGRCVLELLDEDGSGELGPAAGAAVAGRRAVVTARSGSGEEGSVLALPVVFAEEPLGALVVEATRALTREEIEICQVIANAAAPALENARQFERLVQMQRSRGEFLSRLSHEMRTPLGVILGYGDLARERAAQSGDAELRDMLDRVHGRAVELADHVEDLLAFSQAALGRERRRVERVDLESVLRQAVERARGLSRSDALRVSLTVDAAARELYADGEKLKRIADSLLTNAVKFTERGTIEVTAEVLPAGGAESPPQPGRPWERTLALCVRDTGIGIRRADLEAVFEDFRQGDGSIRRAYSGLGLGLSVCRRLAELLGGTIDVESEPGRGSRFRVLLPVQLAAPAPGA